MSSAANYSATPSLVDGIPVVQLKDASHRSEAAIAVGIGNLAYEFLVNGKNLLYFPFSNLADFRSKPALCGNPFLAPWANRLSEDAFWANGQKYALNQEVGNLRRDANGKPIHGLLAFSPLWEIAETGASDSEGAWVRSRLEIFKHPPLLAQFPFAHSIEMTYRLRDGALEVLTLVTNHSREAMPVAIGFHPYFQLHDAPRDEWTVHMPVKERLTLSDLLIPTGEHTPMPYTDPQPLKGMQLDDVFTGLQADARFHVRGKQEQITVAYGRKFTVAVVYAPKDKEFICFEPMSAITDAFNLAHAGLYRELQSIEPDGSWQESYWIIPSGF